MKCLLSATSKKAKGRLVTMILFFDEDYSLYINLSFLVLSRLREEDLPKLIWQTRVEGQQ